MMMRNEDDAFGTSSRFPPGTGNRTVGNSAQVEWRSGPMYPLQTQTPTPATVPVKPKKPLWIWAIIAAVIMVAICGIVGALASTKSTPTPQVVPIATTPNDSLGIAPTKAAPAPPVTIAGKNNTVVPIGAKLNGAFTVDYSFGSWCGIAHFLKADGTEGQALGESINDCAADFNTKLVGKTVVHLKDVTMVKVDNTKGAWSITFTPLGG